MKASSMAYRSESMSLSESTKSEGIFSDLEMKIQLLIITITRKNGVFVNREEILDLN